MEGIAAKDKVTLLDNRDVKTPSHLKRAMDSAFDSPRAKAPAKRSRNGVGPRRGVKFWGYMIFLFGLALD